jgi:hypothetical protein
MFKVHKTMSSVQMRFGVSNKVWKPYSLAGVNPIATIL